MKTLTSQTSKTTTRLAAVAGAAGAALAVWALAVFVLGIDVETPAMGAQPSEPLAAGNVLVTGVVAGLAGWGLLALLERFTARAPRIWAVVALVVTVVSLGGPLTGGGLDTADRAVLTALHLAVAAVLVPVLYRTTRAGPRD